MSQTTTSSLLMSELPHHLYLKDRQKLHRIKGQPWRPLLFLEYQIGGICMQSEDLATGAYFSLQY
jgi:hypothetical protein